MADPVSVPCAADVWTPVAIGVTSGQVWIKNRAPRMYKHTYRMTTNPAPADDALAVQFYGEMIPISNVAAIDVYVKAVGRVGEVIVNL